MPQDCFADEIAIDFPSVVRVVERMRHAFLDDRDDDEVLRTELRVSQRDAGDGLVVPLEVPIRGTCAECGGRGETWTERCGACAGTGASVRRHSMRVAVPPGVANGSRLHFRVSVPGIGSVRVQVTVVVQPAV